MSHKAYKKLTKRSNTAARKRKVAAKAARKRAPNSASYGPGGGQGSGGKGRSY